MKYFIIGLTLILALGVVGCQEDSDLAKELSPEDELAAEGMEEAFETAELYNDSLIWCDTTLSCTPLFINYCDGIFHHHDELFDFHHDNYSHNNVDDDHHHGPVSQHHHGDMVHHDDGGGGHHGHSIHNHEEMNELKEDHKPYHP